MKGRYDCSPFLNCRLKISYACAVDTEQEAFANSVLVVLQSQVPSSGMGLFNSKLPANHAVA